MKWIKCEDQPVPIEGKYLVFYSGYMSVVEHLYDDGNGKPCFFDGGCVINDVTHWMPLPNPPQEENEYDKILQDAIDEGNKRMRENTWMPLPEKPE